MSNSKRRQGLSSRELKILWGSAGGRCSMCREFLISRFLDTNEYAVLGEHAHVKPHSEAGPRGLPEGETEYAIDPTGPENYENTILLCANCHISADSAPQAHTVERLQEIKREHEAWVKSLSAKASGGLDLRIVIKESQKPGSTNVALRYNRPDSFSAAFGNPQTPQPRVFGCKAGPPQTIFDIYIQNHSSISVQLVKFELLVNGRPFDLVQNSSVFRDSVDQILKDPLEPRRTKMIELKVHRLATLLRDSGLDDSVRLTFSFTEACDVAFVHDVFGFQPSSYDDIPDLVQVEEW